jgi:hypothetical protein
LCRYASNSAFYLSASSKRRKCPGGIFSGTAPPIGRFSNATVYQVTNLIDSGPGSLRAAFVQNSANKIIVFDIGGTIQLTSGLRIFGAFCKNGCLAELQRELPCK